MKTKFWTLQLKKQRWRKFGVTLVLLVLFGSGLLFGTIRMIDATQTANPPCEQRTVPDCIDNGQKPEQGLICPNLRTLCPLDTAGKSKDDNSIGGKQ